MGLPEARFLAPTHPIHPPTNTHMKPARYYSNHSGLGSSSFQAKHPLWLTLGHGVSCLVWCFCCFFFSLSFYSSTLYYIRTYIVYHTYVYILLHEWPFPAAPLWPHASLTSLILCIARPNTDHGNSHTLTVTPPNYSSSLHANRINNPTFYVRCVMVLCAPKYVRPETEFHK